MPTKVKREILEELIYDRVRTRLAIRELRALDADLRLSIKETLRGLGSTAEERDSIALEILEKAWERVGADAGTESKSEPVLSFAPAVVAA
jgi:hypothetical protein